MNYILSQKYDTPELQKKIMGPNPVKLAEELLQGNQLCYTKNLATIICIYIYGGNDGRFFGACK